MKLLGIALVSLAVVGCSNTPSKLERIEANETAILELQTRPDAEVIVVEQDTSCPAACSAEMNEKIDRAFKKSQLK